MKYAAITVFFAGLLFGSLPSHSCHNSENIVVGAIKIIFIDIPFDLIRNLTAPIRAGVNARIDRIKEIPYSSSIDETKTSLKAPFIADAYRSQLRDFFTQKTSIKTPSHWLLPGRSMVHFDRNSDKEYVIQYFFNEIIENYSANFKALTKNEISILAKDYQFIFEVVNIYIKHQQDILNEQNDGNIHYELRFLDEAERDQLIQFMKI